MVYYSGWLEGPKKEQNWAHEIIQTSNEPIIKSAEIRNLRKQIEANLSKIF